MATTKQREGRSRQRPAQPKAPGDPSPGALNPVIGDQDPEAAERLAAEVAQAGAEAGDVPGPESGDQEPGEPEQPGGEPEGEHEPAEPTPAERRKTEAAARKAAKEAEAAERKAAKEAEAAERKVPGLCVHGCGERVQRPQAKFVRGHDSLLAKDLRAAYADGDMTAEQVREHATLISAKFLGKMNRSIAAVDAEQAATSEATELRRSLIERSLATAKGETGAPAGQGGQDETKAEGTAA